MFHSLIGKNRQLKSLLVIACFYWWVLQNVSGQDEPHEEEPNWVCDVLHLQKKKAVPDNCTSYFLCQWGLKGLDDYSFIVKNCPDDTVFDEQITDCIDAKAVQFKYDIKHCGIAPTTTTPEPTTPQEPTLPPPRSQSETTETPIKNTKTKTKVKKPPSKPAPRSMPVKANRPPPPPPKAPPPPPRKPLVLVKKKPGKRKIG